MLLCRTHQLLNKVAQRSKLPMYDRIRFETGWARWFPDMQVETQVESKIDSLTVAHRERNRHTAGNLMLGEHVMRRAPAIATRAMG